MAFFSKLLKKGTQNHVDEEFEAARAPFEELCKHMDELHKNLRTWVEMLSGCGPAMMALAQTFEKYYESTDAATISRKFMMAALRMELATKDFIEGTQGIVATVDGLQAEFSSMRRKIEKRDKLLAEYNKALRSLVRGDKPELWHEEAKVSYKSRNKEVKWAIIDFTSNRATYIDKQVKALVASQAEFFKNSAEGGDLLRDILEVKPAQVVIERKPKQPKAPKSNPVTLPEETGEPDIKASSLPDQKLFQHSNGAVPENSSTVSSPNPEERKRPLSGKSTIPAGKKKSLPPPPKPPSSDGINRVGGTTSPTESISPPNSGGLPPLPPAQPHKQGTPISPAKELQQPQQEQQQPPQRPQQPPPKPVAPVGAVHGSFRLRRAPTQPLERTTSTETNNNAAQSQTFVKGLIKPSPAQGSPSKSSAEQPTSPRGVGGVGGGSTINMNRPGSATVSGPLPNVGSSKSWRAPSRPPPTAATATASTTPTESTPTATSSLRKLPSPPPNKQEQPITKSSAPTQQTQQPPPRPQAPAQENLTASRLVRAQTQPALGKDKEKEKEPSSRIPEKEPDDSASLLQQLQEIPKISSTEAVKATPSQPPAQATPQQPQQPPQQPMYQIPMQQQQPPAHMLLQQQQQQQQTVQMVHPVQPTPLQMSASMSSQPIQPRQQPQLMQDFKSPQFIVPLQQPTQQPQPQQPTQWQTFPPSHDPHLQMQQLQQQQQMQQQQYLQQQQQQMQQMQQQQQLLQQQQQMQQMQQLQQRQPPMMHQPMQPQQQPLQQQQQPQWNPFEDKPWPSFTPFQAQPLYVQPTQQQPQQGSMIIPPLPPRPAGQTTSSSPYPIDTSSSSTSSPQFPMKPLRAPQMPPGYTSYN